ncbi:MAG: NADH-quinone oxidoreductase subunit NuoE [Acidobacteriota bacterium]
MQFTAENQREFDRILGRYPQKRAALLPTLYLVQKQEGHITKEAIRWIAALLGVEPVEVYAVITFYTMFRLKPAGRFHLQLCTNVSCMLLGGERLLEHLKNRLGIKPGETTPDGHFTLSTVECLGSCGTAPVIQVNQEAYNEGLDIEKLDRLIEELRAQAESQGEAKA